MKMKLPRVTLVGIDCVDVERIQKALDISSEHIEFAEVKLLTSLPTDDKRKVEIENLETIDKYSEFCIRNLVKYVSTDFALVVQHDGFVLNPNSWDDVFMEYDYVGAPWFVKEEYWFERFKFPEELRNTYVVGNGGFSLRSRKLLETSSNFADLGVFKTYQPEDLAMCVYHRREMEETGIKFAPKEVAERFSIEGRNHVYDKQFGFHGLKWTNISEWISKNPKWGIEQDVRT
jgi:hypothetical protein